jgi:hypothetical protein
MPGKQTTPPKKLTRAAVSRGLKQHHAAMVEAVHGVLKKAGLHGLQVESIRFAKIDGFDDQCDPPCKEGFHCVPVSDGSSRWECVSD